jgi:hypothetical protein
MPQVNILVDFTVVYATEKRSTWSFLCGELSKAKVVARTYSLPQNLKNRSFEEEKITEETSKHLLMQFG